MTLLLIAAVAAACILFVLASPTTRCRRCQGYGTKGWRRRACPPCGGTGIRFRPGAPLAHRALSGYRRHRASGTLTPPPIRPPRHRP